MSGYLSAQRDRFEHALFRASKVNPWCQGYAWDWMVAQAAWKDREAFLGGVTVIIKRGQFYTSIRHMAGEFGWSKSKVNRFVRRLESASMIGTETGTGRLIVTICNYEKYQGQQDVDRDNDRDTKRDTSGTPAGHQRDKKKKGNKGIREKEGARGTRLPPDWVLPKELGIWAVEQGLDEISVRREADKFRDHWKSAPGQKGVKLDWEATWRNWVRRALDDRRTKQPDLRPGEVSFGAFGTGEVVR